jgi:hypothetical protein
MFRKFVMLLLTVPLMAAAYAAGASFPLLLLMGSLLLIAFAAPSVHEDIQE